MSDETYSKRGFLRFGMKRATKTGAMLAQFGLERFADRFTPHVQRPPGAIDEVSFLLECTRCGECGNACPTGAIQKLAQGAGASSGTPFLDVNKFRACAACEDAPCIQACPTDALQELDIRDAMMGTAVVDRDTCKAWNEESCERCYRACPYPDEAIILDEEGKVYVDPRDCIGCGRCVAACPTRPRSVEVEPPPRF